MYWWPYHQVTKSYNNQQCPSVSPVLTVTSLIFILLIIQLFTSCSYHSQSSVSDAVLLLIQSFLVHVFSARCSTSSSDYSSLHSPTRVSYVHLHQDSSTTFSRLTATWLQFLSLKSKPAQSCEYSMGLLVSLQQDCPYPLSHVNNHISWS